MKIVFLFTLGVTIYFALRLTLGVYDYFALSGEAEAKILQWEIEAIGSRFRPKGTYQFTVQEKTFTGVTALSGPLHLNERTALDAVKRPWKAYYNPRSPQVSSLERVFPTNFAVRLGLCLGVLLHFIVNLRSHLGIGDRRYRQE